MKPVDKARAVFRRSVSAGLGYLRLAQEATNDEQRKAMQLACIRELQRFADNDDLIDAMYDEDMRHEDV